MKTLAILLACAVLLAAVAGAAYTAIHGKPPAAVTAHAAAGHDDCCPPESGADVPAVAHEETAQAEETRAAAPAAHATPQPGHDDCCPPPSGTGVPPVAHANEEAGHAAEAHAAAPAAGATPEQGHAAEAHVDEIKLSAEALSQNGIKFAPAAKTELAEVLAVPARVSYNMDAMAHVGTPVQGRVSELHVKLGDTVRKGEALLVIDSPELGRAQSEFLQKRTEAEVARQALNVVRTAAERAKRLHEGQGISLSEYQKRQGEYTAAQGALTTAQAAAAAAENTLQLWGLDEAAVKRLAQTGKVNSRFTVPAPIDGTVVQREVTQGEVVGPDRDALLVLADLRTLWVLADVPEDRLHRIAPGAAATVSVDAVPGRSFTGKVGWIAPELNAATRTAQVRVELPNEKLPLRAGMFAQVKINLGGEKQSILSVPEAAVQEFEGGPTVFVPVKDEPGTYAARPIKVGLAAGGMIPVLAGLEEGTPVCVAGAFVIKAELAKGIMEGKTCSGH